MAHEINNPLTVIVSRSNKLKNLLLKDEYDRAIFLKGIEQVNETALRIAKIIKSLKTISRNADLDPMSIVKLESVIEDAYSLCEERLKTSDIDFSIHYPEDVTLEIEARAPQLTQVLINIINNSVHAISNAEEKWIRMTLGLSISRGIIESHQGKFYYDPSFKNTTFVIEIPKQQKNTSKLVA